MRARPEGDEDLTGKRVVLRASGMKPEFQDEEWRTVDVVGGFGAHTSSDGKMFVRHVKDGSSSYYRNHMVERVVGDVPADEAEFDYEVVAHDADGTLIPLGTVRARSDSRAVEMAAEAAGGKGGFDIFGRGLYTDADGRIRLATAVRASV